MKIWQKVKFRSAGLLSLAMNKRFLHFLTILSFLCGQLWAYGNEENEPRLLSPSFSVEQNLADEIVLRWDIPEEEKEQTHRTLLFAHGPISDGTCFVAQFEWQTLEKGEVIKAGDQITFPSAERYSAKPLVHFREMGFLDGCRIAALQLTLGSRSNTAESEMVFPHGEIRIQFNTVDPFSFDRFAKDMHPVAEQLFLNAPPLRRIDRNAPSVDMPVYIQKPGIKIRTFREGIVSIPADSILPLMEDDLRIEEIACFRDKRPIPFFIVDQNNSPKSEGKLTAGDSLCFYAPRSSSPYAPEAVTWVSLSKEDHKLISPTPLSMVPSSEESLIREFRLEEDHIFVNEHGKNEEQADYWMWHDFQQEGEKEISFALPEVLESATAEISFRLAAQPSYITLASDALKVTLNEDPIECELRPAGRDIFTASSEIAPQQLQAGTNELRVRAQLKKTYSPDTTSVFLDAIEFRYSCKPYSSPEPFLKPTPVRTTTVPDDAEWIWWIRQDGRALNDIGIAQAKKGAVQLPQTGKEWQYYFVSAKSMIVDVSLEIVPSLHSRSLTLSESRQADMILIAPGEWKQILKPFQISLRKDGYSSRFTAIEDIFDLFHDGRLSPYAVRDFLRHAYSHWQNPKPSYVLLVGDATWDYWGRYKNEVVNIVPGFREHTLYAVENWFVRCDEPDDPVPDMMIARWPVRSAAELETVVEKTIRYKDDPLAGDWLNRIFLLTDDTFEQYSDELVEQWIPPEFRLIRRHIVDYPLIDNIYLPERLRATLRAKTSLVATQDILNILDQGVFLWEFFGHGAPNVMGEERMFFGGGSKFSDVKKMTNQRMQPIIWAFTCETTKFDYPRDKWNISIGEDLLTHPEGGAITLIGATGRGYPSDHIVLARAMHEAAFQYCLRTQGQIFLAAQLLGLTYLRSFEPKDQFCILGDPTITFPSFIQLEGQVSQQRNEWNYEWKIPESLGNIAQFTIWSATGCDTTATRTYTSNPRKIDTIDGSIPDDQALRTIGIDGIKIEDGQVAVAHGSIVIEREEEASPVILSTTGQWPDLVFVPDSMHVKPQSPRSGETIFLSATVRNQGKATAENISISGYSEKDGSKSVLKTTVGPQGDKVERLDPGETASVQVRWDPIDNEGEHNLLLQIDSMGKITEENEENNTIYSSIHVRKKADLIFDASRTKVEPIQNGQMYQIYFEVVNQGESPAEKIVIEMAVKQPGGMEITQKVPRIIDLQAGETYNAGGINIPSNIEYFKMTIDPDEIVDEETHENNVFLYTPSGRK